MANARDIRRRIKSVKNTAQITRAMQLVAASKMKKAQNLAQSGRPYAQLLAETLCAVQNKLDAEDFVHPFLESREIKCRGVLLVTTDKGLCGGLNANLFRMVTEQKGDVDYITIGRKGSQFLSRTQRNQIAAFTVSDRVRFHEVRPAMEMLINSYLEKKTDTIEVIYPRFINNLRQEPTLAELLPLTHLQELIEETATTKDYTTDAPIPNDDRELLFEPNPKNILDELLQLYLKREIYQMILEAKASEHSARMVAMKTATDNANTLVDDLTLQYNKARQASITQEILEISAAVLASSSQ